MEKNRSNRVESYRSRCFTSAIILDYFNHQGIDTGTLLQGTGIDKEYIYNPNNWIPVVKFQRIIQNCYNAKPDLTIYDWQKISLRLHRSMVADFFKGVSCLLGTKRMYKMVPRFIRRSCNYQSLELVNIEDGHADFISYLEPDVVKIASGYSFQLTAGTLAAMRAFKGSNPLGSTVLFDQSSLKNIVKKMYRHHRFNYRQRGDRIIIANKTIGRRICLQKESIKEKFIYSKNYTVTPPYNALLITEDLVHNDSVLLRGGDIFDAPYSRMWVTWDTNSKSSAAGPGPIKCSNMVKQAVNLLEEQIKLAEDRFFESEKLRADNRGVFRKLKQVSSDLRRETVKRKRSESLLKAREKEMELQTANMQEANTALRVLLKKRDEDKKKFSEKVLFNIKELILPYLEKLKETDLKAPQRAYVEILESNFGELSNPLALKLSLKYFNLTQAEIRVAILIKQGRTSHQIADLLSLSPRTIDAYRANIRRKLKIKNKKINLCTYLNSI